MIVWGLDPIIMSYFYDYYSASVLTAIGTGSSLLLLLVVNAKRLRQLNSRYFKIVTPISALSAVACLLQKIGLQYTTPANYAFLEHLACVVVPIMLFLLIRKRPTLPQGIAAVLCLCGCFILCGVGTAGSVSLSFGDVLCATAGLMFGANMALLGVYAKDLDMSLYIVVNMAVYFLVAVFSAVLLNNVRLGSGVAEPIHFTFDLKLLLLLCLFGLVSIGLCWLLKNTATVHLEPTVVAIIGPFSAVIAAVISVMIGQEPLTYNLALGAALILIAVLFSNLPCPKSGKGKDKK